MPCKVACRTPMGWFFWDDTLFSTTERAMAFIEKEKDYIKYDLFLVYPDRMKGWSANNDN